MDDSRNEALVAALQAALAWSEVRRRAELVVTDSEPDESGFAAVIRDMEQFNHEFSSIPPDSFKSGVQPRGEILLGPLKNPTSGRDHGICEGVGPRRARIAVDNCRKLASAAIWR